MKSVDNDDDDDDAGSCEQLAFEYFLWLLLLLFSCMFCLECLVTNCKSILFSLNNSKPMMLPPTRHRPFTEYSWKYQY